MECNAQRVRAAGAPLLAAARGAGEGQALRPDRSFDTLACGVWERDPFCAALAALAGGARCMLLGPDAAAALAGWCDGGGTGRVELRATLAVGGDGRLTVEPLRAWLSQPAAEGRLRAVFNGPVGPYLCRPLQMGADVAVEDVRELVPPRLLEAVGLGDGRVPLLVAVCRTDRVGEELEAELAAAVDAGDVEAPARGLDAMAAELLAEALAPLSLRSQRRSDTALVAAHYLAADGRVAWVSYPGLPDDTANDAARRTMEHGFGPLVAFGLVGVPDGGGVPTAAPEALSCGCDRSVLACGPVPGSYVLSAGLENPLDVVGALERLIAGRTDGRSLREG